MNESGLNPASPALDLFGVSRETRGKELDTVCGFCELRYTIDLVAAVSISSGSVRNFVSYRSMEPSGYLVTVYWSRLLLYR
jgi:hypothetical protein